MADDIAAPVAAPELSLEVRVRGCVQGVGFRPFVWRLAHELGVSGDVRNDADGVRIRVAGTAASVRALLARLERSPPPLARIEHVDSRRVDPVPGRGFAIALSVAGAARPAVAPDAALCAQCRHEVLDPAQRRHGYAFASCTTCGPRYSIVEALPFDRAATSMAPFALCPACAAEHGDPADRRFHAQTIACAACGPTVELVRPAVAGVPVLRGLAAIDAAAALLREGGIVAVKALGGYQLACDATSADAVRRLREAKRRDAKPFALMARALDVARRHAEVDAVEAAALGSPAAPIVLLAARGDALPAAIAPGLRTLGFMLPTTPLHALLLRGFDAPLVMTSGNVAGEPPATDDAAARTRLAPIADALLGHDRRIATRLDDSVVRVVVGRARVLRRSRGYAPAPLPLPDGFAAAPDLLALGGDLKAAFCLLHGGQAVLAPHGGDLDEAATFDEFRDALARHAALFGHVPRALAADAHPDYRSTALARELARARGLPLLAVQHHHAHVAACLAENARALAAPPVLGIALDGLGWGADGTLWGGEFLLADYRRAERLATLRPVALPGGDRAAREPWRNLYAHLAAQMGWAEFSTNFAELELHADLAARPRAILDAMIRDGVNAPLASSCGRLFDAVAAALGICRDAQSYEGEAAARLEALVDARALHEEPDALAYPFTLPNLRGSGLPYVEPLPMWRALLGDLVLRTPTPVIAARFHRGLARALAALALKLAGTGAARRFDTVALSGGCFQNAVLSAELARRLEGAGFAVLSHAQVPANDGGLALGQVAIGAARLLARMRS